MPSPKGLLNTGRSVRFYFHRIETKTFLGQKNVNKGWALKYTEELLMGLLIVRILLFWLYKKTLS